MVAIPKIALGAPGIYRAPEERMRQLGGVRMDVCAFVGVAPRGPSRIPEEPEACAGQQIFVDPAYPRHRSVAVAVESWDEYQSLYGGFEGPGRLPYSVASFFEQGGRRAYIVRIVRDYANGGDADDNYKGAAQGELTKLIPSGGPVLLNARNEGSWGNQLKAALGFSVTPIEILSGSTESHLQMDINDSVPQGSLLRLSIQEVGDTYPHFEFRFVSLVRRDGVDADGEQVVELTLDTPLAVPPQYAELVTGEIIIDDDAGSIEHFKGVGLSHLHPRWLAWVLYKESALVYPHEGWLDSSLLPLSASDVPLSARQMLADDPAVFAGGLDRYEDIIHDDFFDDSWVLSDPAPGDGIHALVNLRDLSNLVVPDLYVAELLPSRDEDEDTGSLAGASFGPCVMELPDDDEDEEIEQELSGLFLDPKLPADLEEIIGLQQRLVELAEQLGDFVVLLDVPPGLSQRKIKSWRSRFHSSYVAAYYPWLMISRRDDSRDRLIQINPSAVAAGIIARQEFAHGVPHGPANIIAANVVKVEERVSPARHDELHPLGVNVFLQERDGVWLSAGRTLSRDKRYRQLSVRRLMMMLKRALEQQMQWMVFEPNTPSLWADVRDMLNNYLRQLFIAGAFKGESEEEGFFVRCDGEINHRRIVDAGQMIAEIGVAPAEPLEFLVVHITRGGDGTLTVEA